MSLSESSDDNLPRFYDIDDFSDIGRKLEEFSQLVPIILLGFDDDGILFTPFVFKVERLRFSSLSPNFMAN